MTQIADKRISPVNVEKRKALDVQAGDTVRVTSRIEERGKTRLQSFEGIVIARKHGTEPGATITVRRVSSGIGVEKTYPIYSPLIEKIEIIKRAKVRRAKLYHIKKKAAREIKRQMRRVKQLPDTVVVDSQEDEAEAHEAEATEVTANEQETHAEETTPNEAQEPATEEKEEVQEQPAEEQAVDEEQKDGAASEDDAASDQEETK